ncbi:MATE family efflux transporter [Roseovarius sp. EGI FJ00037]|uniref:MATE family efflux transporter n=1 Tax=Roseovarius salincola TaxID=2978479 RepID=UPI0022A85A34|nr:MATE family efflux transporter [Roseovarius sp. EGI FJ00037]MCZ0814327.1 MATE family efflux transporter [Roseovarius sp. EGI FJ00037]
MSDFFIQSRRHARPSRVPWARPETAEIKALLLLAVPIAGASMVSMGMSITDTLMMGWIGPSALAAGAVVSDLYSLVFYFCSGILAIVATLAASAMGSRDSDALRRAVQSGFVAALLLMAPAFAAVWHAADFVRLLGVEAGVHELGQGYARAMAITILPMLLLAVWRNLFGALERPRIFLMALVAAVPLNALANLILMFGWGPVPALGVTGAGIASALVASALLAGFVAFSVLDPQLRNLRLLQSPWRAAFDDVREIFRLGLPIGVFTLGEVGLFLIATVVVSLFGAEALAAHAVALRMAGLVYAIPTGLSQAVTVRVATAIGRGESRHMNSAMGSAMTTGIASGVVICACLVAGAEAIPGLFVAGGSDSAATATGLLVLLGLLHLGQGLAGPATAVLRAFKDTRIPMQLSLTGYWVIGMPAGALLGFGLDLGVFGIWCGLGLGVFASALLQNLRLFRSFLRPGHAAHASDRS